MNVKIVNKKTACAFYNNPDFIKKNLLPGIEHELNNEEALIEHMGLGFHIGVYAEGNKLYAITQCKPLSDTEWEVHTYVLPEYRKHATEALRLSMCVAKTMGIKKLKTCSHVPIVRNFLVKRLGFKETYSGTIKGLPYFELEYTK